MGLIPFRGSYEIIRGFPKKKLFCNDMIGFDRHNNGVGNDFKVELRLGINLA